MLTAAAALDNDLCLATLSVSRCHAVTVISGAFLNCE